MKLHHLGLLREIVHAELFWVCVPYVGICALACGIWFFFLRFGADGDPPEDDPLEEESL